MRRSMLYITDWSMLYITGEVLVKPKMKEKRRGGPVKPNFSPRSYSQGIRDSPKLTLHTWRFTLARLTGLMIADAKSRRLLTKPLAILFLTLCLAGTIQGQLSTNDHLAEPGFWPTKRWKSGTEYAGEAACAQCHQKIAAKQSKTSMRLTAAAAENSTASEKGKQLTFQTGAIHYQIESKENKIAYTVADGQRTLGANLLWAFGTARVGQSFLFKKEDGNFYEARVTYFHTLENLHFTPTRKLTSPKTLEEAMARRVDALEIERCFACHTTPVKDGEKFNEKEVVPGVRCEACHGPGERHVEEMQAARLAGVNLPAKHIFNSAKLSPADSVDFCGACHSTWWDIKLTGTVGVANVRANPYRLQSSKCWGNGDRRIICIACHDPHIEVAKDASSYDHNCLSCHVSSAAAKPTADHPGTGCPVGTKACSSCHMPKVYDPEMHYNFTDHKIRIAKEGEPYKD